MASFCEPAATCISVSLTKRERDHAERERGTGRTYPLDENGSLEADAGVQAFALRVGKHRCRVQNRSIDRPSDSDRSRRRRQTSSDGEVPALGERRDGLVAVEDDDKLGQVGTDLETEADAAGGDARGGGPGPVGEAGDHDAGPGFAGPDEACFEDGKDGEAAAREMSGWVSYTSCDVGHMLEAEFRDHLGFALFAEDNYSDPKCPPTPKTLLT